MLYTWRLRCLLNGYIMFNLVVSRAKIFELAVSIPLDVLQAAHVLCCRANGRSITIIISGPDSMNEG
jgi:hypothetical protein